MGTVRQLVDVTRRALVTYNEVAQCERMAGVPELVAWERARQTAMREAMERLLKLLECDPCDL